MQRTILLCNKQEKTTVQSAIELGCGCKRFKAFLIHGDFEVRISDWEFPTDVYLFHSDKDGKFSEAQLDLLYTRFLIHAETN